MTHPPNPKHRPPVKSPREYEARIRELEAQKDNAYTERNALVVALSKLMPSYLARHPDDEEWDDDWRWIVFIDSPEGQLSWHIQDLELGNFNHLLIQDNKWDGHTTREKYARLAALTDACDGHRRGKS